MDRISMELLKEAHADLESGVNEQGRLALASVKYLQSDSGKPEDERRRCRCSAPHVLCRRTRDHEDRLRAELQTVGTDTPGLDALNALPFLENVVRESMHVYGPVVSTNRMAMADDVLPLETPYIDTRGVRHHSIAPDRWDAIPEAKAEMNALIFTLVRAFEFKLTGPAAHVKGSMNPAQRPVFASEPEKGNRFSMLVRRVLG
ncbi:hypothetical protein DFH07DRAFT_970157 [Mycena maculata]|uniref:Cytochrome P450 n=1 Tax=Mycena maculata TaxID=230809 RepID=A0AAD7HSW0_9AGAR|nr:hypothetical protein DFH07DRAFT_970157 [Mycena maculata]